MKTVVLGVRSLKESLNDFVRVMETGQPEHEAHISFATPELLWKILTEKRWELIKALCGAGPVSIREAARRVDRDVKAVHGDVQALLNNGVLSHATKRRIEFPYETIKVAFEIHSENKKKKVVPLNHSHRNQDLKSQRKTATR